MNTISMKTAVEIYTAHREITAAETLISEMEKALESKEDLLSRLPRDAFGRTRMLQLGVPMESAGSHRCYEVRPGLAIGVLRAHVADMQRKLVEMCEVAKLEMSGEIPAQESA